MPNPTALRHYLHVTPSFGLGGREMRAVQLIGLAGPAIRHTVVSLCGPLDALERVAAGLRVDGVAGPPPGTAAGLFARLGAMRRYLRALQPDLLLTYNWGAIEWVLGARMAGLRAVVHHEDGFGPDEAQRLLPRRNLFRRAVLRYARAVIVPSRRLEAIARGAWGQPAARVRYLPNGVDLERFRPAPRTARTEVVFGCVGGVRPEKNQVLAVEALARCACRERARLRIVGDGPDLALVQQRAGELGVADRCEFVGAVADTAPEYRELDVFVIPSRTEQMPLALLEAMAGGLPVVGCDVGDVAQMVDPANRAWIVPPLDAAALAAAMDAAASDPAARARLGAANRARAEAEFELATCYGRYLATYADALADR
ncbi:MAG: glycosyltransferase [Planctomycetes bacterium]|nr:glycosyltransferase [Planctomycetota bacterium]